MPEVPSRGVLGKSLTSPLLCLRVPSNVPAIYGTASSAGSQCLQHCILCWGRFVPDASGIGNRASLHPKQLLGGAAVAWMCMGNLDLEGLLLPSTGARLSGNRHVSLICFGLDPKSIAHESPSFIILRATAARLHPSPLPAFVRPSLRARQWCHLSRPASPGSNLHRMLKRKRVFRISYLL